MILSAYSVGVKKLNTIKACCGFGHRQVFDNISERLYDCLLHIAEQGCVTFYTGAMGEFDSLYSATVRELKTKFPQIKLICVKPYMTKDINEMGAYLYTLYDDIIIPTELADVHYKSVIKKRNRLLIDWSDVVICYVKRGYGGAYEAFKYASKSGKCTVIKI